LSKAASGHVGWPEAPPQPSHGPGPLQYPAILDNFFFYSLSVCSLRGYDAWLYYTRYSNRPISSVFDPTKS